ncbi:hypothetical protein [Arcobacter porcinus]|uniref:Putative membrane protein n=1 Tax=Arcobacter porcinus TaxID=1935204 RepID=A0A5C2HH29_9BACT|nr:hypothetical protein [Arcobacter porcinus]OCL96780.1 hypothetical protein AAX27_00412 [Aliarcobacter thereius]QEP40611.1 putative membrane protein [Arcobacter porcinus]
MSKIIGIILSLFTTGGIIGKIFYWIGRKITLTALIVPIQIGLVGAIVVLRISILGAILTLVIFSYNIINDLLAYIDTQLSVGMLEVPYLVLQSLGIIGALSDVFSMFSFVIVTFFIVFLSKLAVLTLSQISDQFYKVGVLLQLGLK